MSEYIEREALLRALSKEVEYDDDGEQEINSDTVFITIEGFPAADVARVVRGEWIHGCTDGSGTEFCYCSACGEDALKDKGGYTEFSRYCPNCGADMRGSEAT